MKTQYVFLLRNDKGFYTVINGKCYFPDRKSNVGVVLNEGIYECKIIREMDTYGFVSLKEVEPERVYSATEAIKSGLVDISDVYEWLQFKGYSYWFSATRKEENIVRDVFTVIDGKLVHLFTTDFYSKTIASFTRSLINRSNSLDLSRLVLGCRDTLIENIREFKDEEEILEVAIHNIDYRHMYIFKSFPEIYLYRNKLVVIRKNSLDREVCGSFSADGAFLIDDDILFSSQYKEDELVNISEKVKETIKEYNIAVVSSSDIASPDIVSKRVTCFGMWLDVKFVNSNKFSFNTYNQEYKGIIESSKKEFESFKKNVCKFTNKKNLSELKALNISDWQLGIVL